MAGVFLSYDRDDSDRTRPVAAALEKAGHDVWWDLHVRGGAQFSKVIEEALKAADAVVVLWSQRSIESAWVRDEATAGRDSGKLVPVTIDGIEPPLGFRQFQTIDMSGGNGRRAAPNMPELLRAIDAIASGGAMSSEAPARTSAKSRPKLRQVPLLLVVAALVLASAAMALLAWRPWSGGGPPAISVSAADASPASRDLSRDLLTTLGQLQTASSTGLELVGAEDRKRASLAFEVAATSDGQQSRANLVLLDGRDGSLLWSKAFERPAGMAGDLRQEVGYTAAQVLRCALEAHPGRRAVLKDDALRLYLNGCAGFSDVDAFALAESLPVFRQIVSAAPRFEDGWSKLLMIESQAYVSTRNPRLRAQLTRDIETARTVNPRLGAAYAAEMDMLPYDAWTEKLAIADRGIAANSSDTWLLMLRSEVLSAVGRMRDAVDDLRLAVRADPLSPRLRGLYVNSLGAADQLDAALSELQAAERLWPDSSSLARDKFQFHFDYGDPRIALRFIRSGDLEGGWAHTQGFMEARIDPTPAKIERAIENARASYRRNPMGHLWLYVEVLGIFHRNADLLSLLMSAPLDQVRSVTSGTFGPWAGEFWRNSRSLAYARRVGLIQYWRSSGKWPDFCFEPDLPYDCKKEAAKLAA
jgi:tetratricopeptide (TPR) repeat protein